MWQRAQTLYLALAALVTAILIFGDAATATASDGIQYIRYADLARPYFIILLIILGLGELLALISFKVRILQMRVATICALVALGIQIWLGYMYFSAPDEVVFRWTVILPLIAAIFNALGARGALQDQLVVESATRLRDRRRRNRKK